jgi:LmbE family N-acetylglucosaminyl deacetylase
VPPPTPRTPDKMHVCVVSPHLDDAVFSIGALIWYLAHARGHRVTIVTVFAGESAVAGPPSSWDAECGFEDRGVATDARRREDDAACERLGAAPAWLAFAGAEYSPGRDDGEIAGAVVSACEGCDVVLVPGFPLRHPDHAAVGEIATRSPHLPACVGYAEEPYAVLERAPTRSFRAGRARGDGRTAPAIAAAALRERGSRERSRRRVGAASLEGWIRIRPPLEAWRHKWEAVGCYRSQLRGFSPFLRPGVLVSELVAGGELVWVPAAPSGSPEIGAFVAEVATVSRPAVVAPRIPKPPWGQRGA